MRKAFSIITLALMLLATTACSDDKSDDMTYQIQGLFVNNAVKISSNQSVRVSSSQSNIYWNLTTSTMSINYTVPLENGNTVTLDIKDVELNPNNTLECYTFETQNGGNGITAVKGFYSPDNNSFLIEFTANGTHRVISAAQLLFPYLKCTINNIENPEIPAKVSNNATLLIDVDPTDMTADVTIFKFSLDANSGIIGAVKFLGLDIEATADGYRVTTTKTHNSVDGLYKLNAFEANVTEAAHKVSGTFTINSKFSGEFTGTAFAH